MFRYRQYAVSESETGLAWAPVDWWVCEEGFADWLAPGDGASPLAGTWETDEEQKVEDHQDRLQTSAAGSDSWDITTPFSETQTKAKVNDNKPVFSISTEIFCCNITAIMLLIKRIRRFYYSLPNSKIFPLAHSLYFEKSV